MYRSGNRWVAAITLMALLAGVLISAAAQASAGHDSALSVVDKPIIVQAPTPTVTPLAPEIVFFNDDFETYSHRWEEKESPKASVMYRDGTLNLRVVAPGISVWSVPDFDTPLKDYRIETTVDYHDGSPDAQFGFVLDYQRNPENFYALVVASTGKWQFLRYQDAQWIDLTPHDAAIADRGLNEAVGRIGAELTPGNARFFVDGVLAGEASVEDDMTAGVFGLIARAERGYIDVSFDDARVTSTADQETGGS